ncbi:hypothetical protein [Dyadobacter sp. CY261]|uniref:hypothetical protein n=1 Tax=Dyadobacter sp. CY261 TaxID=2907203 RepID=UPI0038D4BDC9
MDVDTSLSSKRIIRTLNRIGKSSGFPRAIRSDNGPEFTRCGGPLERFCDLV